MKHVVNILLLGMVLLGIPMMAHTPWGLGLVLAPFVVWGVKFLFLIHRSFWAAVIFWGGIAYFQWQVALVGGALFGLMWFIRAARAAYKEAPPTPPTRRRKEYFDDPNHFIGSFDPDLRLHMCYEDEV